MRGKQTVSFDTSGSGSHFGSTYHQGAATGQANTMGHVEPDLDMEHRMNVTSETLDKMKGKKLIDDSAALNADMRFDGKTGGNKWKDKVGRMLVGKLPALLDILKYAELAKDLPDSGISNDMLAAKFYNFLSREEISTISHHLWNFLTNVLSGDAEQEFKRAATLNGVDAWRRVVRLIDNGRALLLERVKAEFKAFLQKPWTRLDQISPGITMYENKITELKEAGGKEPDMEDKISDLKGLLPKDITENVIWCTSLHSQNYNTFRDTLTTQVAKVLVTQKKAVVNNIACEEGLT